MAIARHEPKAARPTSLRELLVIGLDEALTALEESFYDLTDEQVWARPFADRHGIATLVMHVQENVDRHGCLFQTGRLALEHDERFDVWKQRDPAFPPRQADLPSVAEMLERHRVLREAVMTGLDGATERDLLGPRAAENTYWWREHHRTSASAYARTIWHIMGHVRQIWLMRGRMGLTDQDGWPQQHYH